MKISMLMVILMVFSFSSGAALAADNPLGLQKNCAQSQECVVKALEKSADNESLATSDPFSGLKYISISSFWKAQRHANTPLWKSVTSVCPTMNGGHYPSVPYNDFLVLGCQEAEYGK